MITEAKLSRIEREQRNMMRIIRPIVMREISDQMDKVEEATQFALPYEARWAALRTYVENRTEP